MTIEPAKTVQQVTPTQNKPSFAFPNDSNRSAPFVKPSFSSLNNNCADDKKRINNIKPCLNTANGVGEPHGVFSSVKSVLDTGHPVNKTDIIEKINNLIDTDPALLAINKLLMAL